MRRFLRWFARLLGIGILGLAILALYIELRWPARTDADLRLAREANYHRYYRSLPQPHAIHVVEVAIIPEGIEFQVTAGSVPGQSSFLAKTTTDFARETDVDVAINTSFFHPSWTRSPWDYYPKSGQPTEALGRVISNEVSFGDVHSRRGVFCVLRSNQLRIRQARCPAGTLHSVPGAEILLTDGALPGELSAVDSDYLRDPQPRSALGLNDEGTRLWLVVVDGRQPTYSEGISAIGLADFLIGLGADTALLLDGGGSSTLVVKQEGEPGAINSPVHTRIPGRERPVAVHLGIRFRAP